MKSSPGNGGGYKKGAAGRPSTTATPKASTRMTKFSASGKTADWKGTRNK